MHSAVCGTHTEVHHRYPDLSEKQLGGWKDTTAFHKSSKTNRHQVLKHLRQYRCYGNWSVVGNRGGRWTLFFGIGVTLACLQQAGKLPRRTNKPPKHNTKTGGQNISSSGPPNCYYTDSTYYTQMSSTINNMYSPTESKTFKNQHRW